MKTDTLTDRYVSEVVRRIPADQRTDVAAELRATIADTVEARGADSERAVLDEMGDPRRLADRYADRPLALIGPELYPAYIWLLRLLVFLVLPVVLVGVVFLDVGIGARYLLVAVTFMWAFSYYNAEGERVWATNGAVWDFWAWVPVTGLAAIVLVEAVRLVRSRWDVPLAVVHAVAQAVFAVPLAALLFTRAYPLGSGFELHPTHESILDLATAAVAVGLLLVAGFEAYKRFRQAHTIDAAA